MDKKNVKRNLPVFNLTEAETLQAVHFHKAAMRFQNKSITLLFSGCEQDCQVNLQRS